MALHAWIQSGKLIKNSGGILCVAEDHPCGGCVKYWWCVRGPDLSTGTGTGTSMGETAVDATSVSGTGTQPGDILQCVYRTEKEKDELRDEQGYEILSGPYTDAQECLENCLEPLDPITTACCPDPTPGRIFATFTDKAGCPDLPDEVTLEWNSSLNRYEGGGDGSSAGEIDLFMPCVGVSVTNFELNSSFGQFLAQADSGTCDPFLLTFTPTIGGAGACNGETLTIVISG